MDYQATGSKYQYCLDYGGDIPYFAMAKGVLGNDWFCGYNDG
ncbi:hypothetical protein ACFLTP_04380 [Chloroflexota bacterium]